MVLILPIGSFLIWGLIACVVGDVTRVRVLSFEYLAREIRFTDFVILRAQTLFVCNFQTLFEILNYSV